MNNAQPEQILTASFQAAIAAADPLHILPQHLPAPPIGRTVVVGAGKAAAAMAVAVEQHWPWHAPLSGTVVTRYQHGMPTKRIKVIEASHPVPDGAGEMASREILQLTQSLCVDDLLIVLISGGGSSLLALPAEGLTMEDLKTVTAKLLQSGAPIQEINIVRKHLSAIQGGRLAASTPAQILTLIISDVTGDDPTHIASGPCAPDPSTYQDAINILNRYQINASVTINKHLSRGVRGEIDETPKPGSSVFVRTENRVIATAHQSLKAAASYFNSLRIPAVILGDSVTGEARDVAKVYGALARQIKQHQTPWPAPIALISGGECTVTVRQTGRGGRCSEFLLALAIDLDAMPNTYALAGDTDGIDGSENNAGALLLPNTLALADKLHLSAQDHLDRHDSFEFFEALNALIVTGPTRTNVNDYRAILLL
jgi:hydroxypyruvate reductase